MPTIGVLCAIAFIISLLIVKFLSIQFRQTLVDLPNKRSSHTHPTPRGGGLGFIFSFISVMAIATIFQLFTVPFSLWLSLLPLVIVGFMDDWKNLSASARYYIQLSVSCIMIFQLGTFPLFEGQDNSHLLIKIGAIVLTIIGITALINFYNFMDGLDGLVASITTIQLSFLALWLQNPSLWILAAAILGFLVWNWHPAQIFMGDSGSTFLGAAIAITLLSQNTSTAQAWAGLSITLPITLDTIYTLVRRLLQGENIFQAHRTHLFQRLHQSGWSHPQVTCLYAIATLLSSITLLAFGTTGSWLNIIGASFTLAVIEFYLKNKKNTNIHIPSNI